jgi:hypothetical protein
MRYALIFMLGCSARETAKDAYDLQSHACIVAFDGDSTKQKDCVDYVRNKWTEAGAPTADGGSHD